MASSIKQFNMIFIEFITDLNKVFPDDRDIKDSIVSSSMLIRMRPYVIAKMFSDNLVKYENHIRNRDIQFLFSHDFKEPIITFMIDKMKCYWSLFTNDNKEIMWKYIDTMIYLLK